MGGGATYHTVQCPACGEHRNVSWRTRKLIREGQLTGRCRPCAYARNGATVATGQRFRNYWLNPQFEHDGRLIHPGFTIEQIRSMAEGLELLLDDGSRYAKERDGRVRHQTADVA